MEEAARRPEAASGCAPSAGLTACLGLCGWSVVSSNWGQRWTNGDHVNWRHSHGCCHVTEPVSEACSEPPLLFTCSSHAAWHSIDRLQISWRFGPFSQLISTYGTTYDWSWKDIVRICFSSATSRGTNSSPALQQLPCDSAEPALKPGGPDQENGGVSNGRWWWICSTLLSKGSPSTLHFPPNEHREMIVQM